MARMSAYSLGDVMKLRKRLDEELRCASLADAGQAFTGVLYEELEESAVLFRLFGTVPFGGLGSVERAAAKKIAEKRGFVDEMDDETRVVCLLGSSGRRAAWNDRHQSMHHLAIPLTQASFIQTIPMIARLMSDMGTGLDWVEKQKSRIVVKTFGTMARMLHVEDAASARTSDGFQLIPDQDFVRANGIKTVLGIGGAYLNRSVVTAILFTNETIARKKVEKFMPIINTFKTATMKLVNEGKYFG